VRDDLWANDDAQVPSDAPVVTSVPSVPPASAPQESAGGEAQLRHDSFRPGASIADKFVVERVIGEGGLGVVVAAHHKHLDQTVAIKYLRPKVLGNKVVTERFLREARLAAKIRSQHVVRVYDVGTLPDGAPYMIMEYLAGTDLGHVLQSSGPLPFQQAVDYVLQACEALAEAHVAGIVHRDLKPDNLFLAKVATGKSIVKVLDFGISKLSSKRPVTGRTSQLTDAGEKFGTPVYMSPEQLRSSTDVDARADVWAVGVILYELLTGRLPFDGEGMPELCTAILALPPTPLTSVSPHLPASMQAIIERCLEKDRENRFHNVGELAQELQAFATPTGRASIADIVQVIREAGESVRPSMPDVTGNFALREAVTLPPGAPPEERAILTTSSGAASWGATQTEPGAPNGWRRWRIPIFAAAGAAVILAVGVTRIHGHASSASAAPAAMATAATVREPSKAASVSLETPPVAVIAAPSSTPTAADSSAAPAAAPVVAATPPARRSGPAHPGKAPSAAKAAASAAPPPQAQFDPNAVINPFQ
jgi:serine/threonine-protein kinase